jgi:dihydroorotase
MSKFLTLGLSLEEVVAKATVEPARIIGRVPGLGTLQVGAPADISVFDIVDGTVEFLDTRNNKRSGNTNKRAYAHEWGSPRLVGNAEAIYPLLLKTAP